ncbi:MAG: allophanate hydrolase subunit 1 [Xanthobacteraceae bacterium]|nr:allophanate hydrolase subunit 1 [Xanthobacteraceae bacterium]
MTAYRLLHAGDTAVVVEFGETIDRRLNALVLGLDRSLSLEHWVFETVPTFRSLMVYYNPEAISGPEIASRIADHVSKIEVVQSSSRTWRLPVCYDSEVAPDLDDVAARLGLRPKQVVERHSGDVYHVYMLGFLPGLAYMGDLAADLRAPRLQSPRVKIPAGSLGVAMAMSLIMPRETASGLNLLGRSPASMWHGDAALLKPGDKVIHEPISLREFDSLMAQSGPDGVRIEQVEEVTHFAA